MQIVNQFSGLLMIIISAALLTFSILYANKNLSRRWPLLGVALILVAAVTYFFYTRRGGHLYDIEHGVAQDNDSK